MERISGNDDGEDVTDEEILLDLLKSGLVKEGDTMMVVEHVREGAKTEMKE